MALGPPRWPPLQRFAWLVNASIESPFTELIADEKASVTLLAPDDESLTPPHRRGEHGHGPPHGPPHHGHDHEHEGPHGPRHGPPHGPPHHGHDHEHEGPHGPRHGPGHEHEHTPASQHPFHSPRLLSSLIDQSAEESALDGDSDRKKELRERFLRLLFGSLAW